MIIANVTQYTHARTLRSLFLDEDETPRRLSVVQCLVAFQYHTIK